MQQSLFNIREVVPTDHQLLTELVGQIESFAEAVPRVVAKAQQRMLVFWSVPPHPALLLKQELLASDGDALIAPAVYLGQSEAATPILAWASTRAWHAICDKLQLLPLPLCQQLAQEIRDTIDITIPGELNIAGHTWRWGERTLVMGIVNATPDSFSHDGLLNGGADPVAYVSSLTNAGADIIDIGGESTRPGASFVAADEELQRVVPLIEQLSQCGVPISVDTYKAEVAAAALEAGAHMINDIWGLRTPDGEFNSALARVVAERGVPIVLMHNRRAHVQRTKLGGYFTAVEYADLLAEVCADLRVSIAYAREQGIAPEQIIIDPGLGFGKTPAQNIVLLQRLHELRSLGYPLLIGSSRKSFIGLALNAPETRRAWGTAATVTHAIAQGADIVRVHDVEAMVDVCRMSDALVRPGAWQRLTQA